MLGEGPQVFDEHISTWRNQTCLSHLRTVFLDDAGFQSALAENSYCSLDLEVAGGINTSPSSTLGLIIRSHSYLQNCRDTKY
jgi:hypothetical protein